MHAFHSLENLLALSVSAERHRRLSLITSEQRLQRERDNGSPLANRRVLQRTMSSNSDSVLLEVGLP